MMMRYEVYCGLSIISLVSLVAFSNMVHPNVFSALLGMPDGILGLAIVSNCAVVLAMLSCELIVQIFLGSASRATIRSMGHRAWPLVFKAVGTWASLDDLYQNKVDMILKLVLLFELSVLHWVCKMRVRGLRSYEGANIDFWMLLSFARIFTMNMILLGIDIVLFWCGYIALNQRPDWVLLFGVNIIDQLELSLVTAGEFLVTLKSIFFLNKHPEEDDWEPSTLINTIVSTVSVTVTTVLQAFFVRAVSMGISDVGHTIGRLSRLSRCYTRLAKVLLAKSEIGEFTEAATAEEVERDNTCVICREDMHAEDVGTKRAPVKLRCKHVIHAKCLLMWISTSSTCPTCRQSVRSLVDSSHKPDVGALVAPDIPLDEAAPEADAVAEVVSEVVPVPAVVPDAVPVAVPDVAPVAVPEPGGLEDATLRQAPAPADAGVPYPTPDSIQLDQADQQPDDASVPGQTAHPAVRPHSLSLRFEQDDMPRRPVDNEAILDYFFTSNLFDRRVRNLWLTASTAHRQHRPDAFDPETGQANLSHLEDEGPPNVINLEPFLRNEQPSQNESSP